MEAAGRLIIAADCGVRVGTGHVMRCLALAQAWRRVGGAVTFVLPEGSPGIERRLVAAGLSLESLPSRNFPRCAVDRILQSECGVVALDGYGFGSCEQRCLSEAGRKVLLIDDYGHATDYSARWVLNQSACAGEETYVRRDMNTRLLLGAQYALLRDEFQPWLGWERTIPERAGKILVTVGGSDPDNLSLQILESMGSIGRSDLHAVLVVGGSNPHGSSLQSAVARLPFEVRIVHDATDMPALMEWADVAVSGAGGTSHELCYMGLPSLLFIVAANQRHVAEHLSGLSAAVHLGDAAGFDSNNFSRELRELIESRGRRASLSLQARKLVDGLGASRVRAALVDRELRLRVAGEDDSQLLFQWANDPAVRQASFHSSPIARDEHRRWFSEKIRDPRAVIYIGEDCAGKPVGQVRFDLEAGQGVLSVLVSPEFRGKGWGRELIWFATRTLARSRFCTRIDAYVKPQNHASLRLFESTGFAKAGSATVAGQPATLFSWQCEGGVHAN